jgi:hypothetical protein
VYSKLGRQTELQHERKEATMKIWDIEFSIAKVLVVIGFLSLIIGVLGLVFGAKLGC